MMKNDEEATHDHPTNGEEIDEEPREESTETSTTKASTMKLLVRSQYWGRVLKGRLRRSFDSPANPYRVIACQAVLSNEGQFWGCCPHHGKRVLELKEEHLEDHHAHDWDLYMVGSSVSPTYNVHNFFMLPQNQTTINIDNHMAFSGWKYVGTISAHKARSDLRELLQDVLQQNDSFGYRYHHAHLEILMDSVFDRETPRTRKVANAMNREKRFKMEAAELELESSTASTTGGSSTQKVARKSLSKIHRNYPPIPHVISNDGSSLATETTHTSSSLLTNWSDPGLVNQQHPSYCAEIGAETMAPPVRWYPAAPPMAMPPTSLSETQQVLQGYPIMSMGGTTYTLPQPNYHQLVGPSGWMATQFPGPPQPMDAHHYYHDPPHYM